VTDSPSLHSPLPKRQSEQAGWGRALPYEADRIGCIVGTGLAASRRSRLNTTRCASAARKRSRPSSVPMNDV